MEGALTARQDGSDAIFWHIKDYDLCEGEKCSTRFLRFLYTSSEHQEVTVTSLEQIAINRDLLSEDIEVVLKGHRIIGGDLADQIRPTPHR